MIAILILAALVCDLTAPTDIPADSTQGAGIVQDTTPPVIQLLPDSIGLTTDVYHALNDLSRPAHYESLIRATDAREGDLTANIVVTGKVDPTTEGEYVLTYNVSDSSANAAVPVTRTVYVVASLPVDTVTVHVEIIGQGTVTPNTNGAAFAKMAPTTDAVCRTYCEQRTNYNPACGPCDYNEVTFEAIPATGWTFKAWWGDLYQATSAKGSLAMERNKYIIAEFVPLPASAQGSGFDLAQSLAAAIALVADAPLNPHDYDRNKLEYSSGSPNLIGNGIPDMVEFEVVSRCLSGESYDFALAGGGFGRRVAKAWEKNFGQAFLDLVTNAEPSVGSIDVVIAFATYATIGTMDSDDAALELAGHLTNTSHIDLTMYDNFNAQHLKENGDFDADRQSNAEEWANALAHYGEVSAASPHFIKAVLGGENVPAQGQTTVLR